MTGDRIDETTDLFDSYSIHTTADSMSGCESVSYDKETKTKTSIQISHEEKRLKEFKDELEAYSDEKIEELKKEIDKLIHDKKYHGRNTTIS